MILESEPDGIRGCLESSSSLARGLRIETVALLQIMKGRLHEDTEATTLRYVGTFTYWR